MSNRTGAPDSYDPLAALAVHLSARRLAVTTTAAGLRVVNKDVPGCCGAPGPAVGRGVSRAGRPLVRVRRPRGTMGALPRPAGTREVSEGAAMSDRRTPPCG